MKQLSVKNFWALSLLVILFALSFKLIPAWFSPLRREWLLLVLATVILFIKNAKSIMGNILFIIWGLYAMMALLKGFTGAFLFPTMQFAVYDALMLFVATFLPLYVISSNNRQEFMKVVLFGTFILLIIEAVASYFVLQVYPGAIRDMYTLINEEGAAEGYRLYRSGLADYAQCHALPVLIPPLFYVYKSNKEKKAKRICAIFIAVCVILTWMSDATTALLLLILMLILGLLTHKGKSSRGAILIIIVFIPFIFSDELQLLSLNALDSILGGDSIFSSKIHELEHAITHNESSGDLESRMDKYTLSLNLFFSSPLWGVNSELGRHSAILDRLATFGILGFIPLVGVFVSYFKRIYRMIPADGKLFFAESVLASLMMLLTKGMWLWPMFFFMMIVMPFMFIYDFKREQ